MAFYVLQTKYLQHKLIAHRLFKKFSLHENYSGNHWTFFRITWTVSTYFLKCTLKLSFHLHLGLPIVLSIFEFLAIILQTLFHQFHLMILYLITLTTPEAEHKFWSSIILVSYSRLDLCSFSWVQSPFILCSRILLIYVFGWPYSMFSPADQTIFRHVGNKGYTFRQVQCSRCEAELSST